MTIVFFDYWTKGIINFIEIDKQLKELGHKTLLLHIGSFNSPHPKNEIIQNIDVYDIRYFDTIYIYQVLKKIKPDVVLGLNTTYILDRCLVLSCRKLNIKSVFMMHGQRNVGKDLERVLSIMKNRRPAIVKYLSKINKYFSIVIPNYLYVLSLTNLKKVLLFNWLVVFIKTAKNPYTTNYYPPSAEEVIYDKCLIYASRYIDYYRKVGYPQEAIKIVGDPKNEKIFEYLEGKREIELPLSIMSLVNNKKPYALYIEDGFVEQQFGNWTADYLSTHLLEVYQRLKKDNIALVVKLHPVTNKAFFEKATLDEIIFTQDVSPEPLIKYADFCIANASSLVNMALLMYKPILTPQWTDSFNKLPQLYASAKVTKLWRNINDPLELNVNKEAIDQLLEQTVTVRTTGSVSRIIHEILS